MSNGAIVVPTLSVPSLSVVAHVLNAILDSSAEEKYRLITQNLAEVLGGEQLKALLLERDAVA